MAGRTRSGRYYPFARVATPYLPEPVVVLRSYDKPSGFGVRGARVVDWPRGAPDPSTVPHAGARLVWGSDGKTRVTVVNGIPFHRERAALTGRDGYWCLMVQRDDNKFGSEVASIQSLRTIPVEPERTYTEAEIRAAVDENGITNDLISQLRSNS